MTVDKDAPQLHPDTHLAPAMVGGPALFAEDEDELGARRTWSQAILRHFLRDPRGLIGLALVGSIALLCILAPLIGRYDPNLPNVDVLNQAPNSAHWFGTDDLGRDLWARLLSGGRVSLPAGLEIVFFSFILGVPFGMIAGFGGRVVEDIIMRLVDLLLAVPGLLLAIAIVGVLGPGEKSVVIGLGFAGIPGYARVARASTLQLK